MSNYPLHPQLSGLHPYGAPQLDLPVLLNVNENPYPVPQSVIESMIGQISKACSSLNRYPDRDFLALRQELVKYLSRESFVDLNPEQIWAANGSNEVMLHLFQAFGGPSRVALSADPSYSMYPEYARDTNTEWITCERNSDFSLNLELLQKQIVEHNPSLVVLASPNNPTGNILGLEEVKDILDYAKNKGPQGSDAIVVIDEAYAEFRRPGVSSALELLGDYENLVVTRTMSKAFAMAGLRLGYLAGHKELIDILKIVRLPYHLSAITQAGAIGALQERELLQAQVAQLRSRRDQLARDLRELGLQVASSDANFIMFGIFDNPEAIFDSLRDQGILIRQVGPAGWLRVSIGTQEETLAFLTALKGELGK